ncbi:ribosomal protein S15 [Thiovulum sp. ES]|nr:ribosomal protein S15 [Thiovulum sp. ES]
MALELEQKSQIISEFARQNGDTGSPEVQIAIFSKRISQLTEHLKDNHKDHSSRLGLLKLVGKRKRLMRYLKKSNRESYNKLVADLGIRDNI